MENRDHDIHSIHCTCVSFVKVVFTRLAAHIGITMRVVSYAQSRFILAGACFVRVCSWRERLCFVLVECACVRIVLVACERHVASNAAVAVVVKLVLRWRALSSPS